MYREWIPLHPYWFIGSCHYCSKIKMRMNWKKGNHQFTKLFMLKIRVEAVFSSLGKSFIEFKKQTSNFRERSLNTFVV